MFAKRDDGLGWVFVPFLLPAAVLAALLTIAVGATLVAVMLPLIGIMTSIG